MNYVVIISGSVWEVWINSYLRASCSSLDAAKAAVRLLAEQPYEFLLSSRSTSELVRLS